MDSFEETVLKAKGFLDSACKKTGEVVSVQKLKIELAGLKNDAEKLYAVLGEKYFGEIRDTEIKDDELSKSVCDIKAKLAEMDLKQAEIEKLQKKFYCKTCGAAVLSGSVFCSKCGTKVSED